MAAQHVGLFMLLWIGSVAAGDLEEVNARPGQNVTLQCHTSRDAAITVLEWKRSELEQYVFYYRDSESMEIFQNQRYRGRVELSDPEMKNGDFTILLKNVSTNDTGTYKCRVITRYNNRWKRDVREFVHSVLLSVSEGSEKHLKNGDANDEQPGGPGGYVGLGVGLVCLIVVAVVAGLVVKSKRAKEKRPSESVDEKVNVELNPRHVPDLFTPDCPPSPASKLNHLLHESLP
ncbi:butyrophilin-like protein 2 [Trematomus bernacchii]|uniref:butyrophilin-like protein 2 n=1 Tax=Trematomus bernacchii TaxID=40690 RepID=UPI00146D6A4D|nr:butyrophilin-like protein 2 [Trematomus bernacchii]